ALVRTAFARDGAFGLSTGLIYAPAKYSQTDEILALARVAAEHGGFYHSHIRDEADRWLPALDEIITIAREAEMVAIVTHIKASGPGAWPHRAEAIRRIEAARASGVRLWADQYPYEAGMTFLATNVLPGWAEVGGLEATRARLQDPATRARIRTEALANLAKRGGPGAFLIGGFEPDPSLQGRRLDAIARAQGAEPVDVALDLIARGEPRALTFTMRDEDVIAFMRQPWTMTGSDGFGVAEPHPRSYGTFPRKLRVYALDRKIISLERAIQSMTGQPAEVLGITDRGFLRPGAYADVVVFDPAKVRDKSTFEESRQLAEGMIHVFVNGRAALADGQFTDTRAGRVLSRR
ncbi:MAG TPA: amidohydrolase family protein, partial [Opitutaceae bacterium]|nr:amidohydrolase family protein [Opitutaceae bacterium]